MNKIIALDDGHGMETPGKRTPLFPDGSCMKENEFNRAVVAYLDNELKNNGFKTLLVAEGDADVSLASRTNLANNKIRNKYNKAADLYISVHANANTGQWGDWGGIETYIHQNADSITERLGAVIHKHLMQGTILKNRGLKRSDLHVLRETKMPAVLVECGFMDNMKEAELLKTDSYRKECAKELAKAVCEFYEVPYKNTGDDDMNVVKREIALTIDGVTKTVETANIDGCNYIKARDFEKFNKKVTSNADTKAVTIISKNP